MNFRWRSKVSRVIDVTKLTILCISLPYYAEGSSSSSSITSSSSSSSNCCKPPYALFDCTGAGYSPAPGKMYTCVSVEDSDECMTCLETENASGTTCGTCCSLETDVECKSLKHNDWEFYLSTVFFVCLCCCFSALCGFTEARRKKKGISFAEAWSIPQAMPILRTWPRRSVSVSDAMAAAGAEGEGWTPLSDDEEDLKRYPVAGLVDDSGLAFGFVTSMPQSLLGSVSASLRRQNPIQPVVATTQEPELTVWISREGEASTSNPAISEVDANRPPTTGQAAAVVGQGTAVSGTEDAGRSSRRMRTNSLQEPLIFGGRGVGAASDGSTRGGTGRGAPGVERIAVAEADSVG